VLEGAGRQIFGSLKIADSQGVQVKNIITSGELIVQNSTGLATKNISINRSQFGGTIGQAFTADAVENLTVLDSSFKCSCPVPTTVQDDFLCVHLFPENVAPGFTISPLDFERNLVESNCVKTMKLVSGAVSGGSQRIHHVLKDNFFHSTFNTANGNEPSNLTWRSSPGGTTSATRNLFSGNTLISEGNATGFYARDDDDNVDYIGNCFETKNPNNYPIFGGSMFFTSGSDAPKDASGLLFYNNRVYSRTSPALNFQGMEPMAATSPSRTVLFGNLFASDGDYAFVNSSTGASDLWVHNTFYSANTKSVQFDGPLLVAGSLDEFYDNIFACSRATSDNRFDCLTVPGLNGTPYYKGSNNLFFNYQRSPVQVYFFGQVDLPVWLSGGNDPNSKQGDPLFINRNGHDFKISASSPARNMARVCGPNSLYCGGSDAGALQFSSGQPPPLPGGDRLSPNSPLNLRVN